MTVEQLHEQRDGLTVLDVREPHEWAEGHIEDALHMPFYAVGQRFAELNPSQPMAVICGSGQRSTVASSVLQRHGFQHLFNVVGGMEAWEKAGLPETR